MSDDELVTDAMLERAREMSYVELRRLLISARLHDAAAKMARDAAGEWEEAARAWAVTNQRVRRRWLYPAAGFCFVIGVWNVVTALWWPR